MKHTFTSGTNDASQLDFSLSVSRFLVLVTKVNVMIELTPFVNHQIMSILCPCHQKPQLENLFIPKCFDFFPPPVERVKIQYLEVHSSLENETSDIVDAIVNLVEKCNIEDKLGFCVCDNMNTNFDGEQNCGKKKNVHSIFKNLCSRNVLELVVICTKFLTASKQSPGFYQSK